MIFMNIDIFTCKLMMTAATASSSTLLLPSAGSSLLAIHHWAVAPVGMPEVAPDRATCRGPSCCAGQSTNRVVLDIRLMAREGLNASNPSSL